MSPHNKSTWYQLISAIVACVLLITPIAVAAAPGAVTFPDQAIPTESSNFYLFSY